ncbi:MAG: hypothetical protein M3O36_02170 [Myxococcota bacterium]|nr:hypothetical protein [Myxococcota bacterium]
MNDVAAWIVAFGQGPLLSISAAALWGGNFYFFESDRSPTDTAVLRFCPGDGSLTRVAHWPTKMLLAAVQTTAPTQ